MRVFSLHKSIARSTEDLNPAWTFWKSKMARALLGKAQTNESHEERDVTCGPFIDEWE